MRSNLPGRAKFPRRLAERVLGITAARPLPTVERTNLFRRHRRAAVEAGSPLGTVCWLTDSFATFTEPHIGTAVIELLERSGRAVELSTGGCRGRSSTSKGLLDDARWRASALVASLTTDTQRDSPIVGREPSCLFIPRDEHVAPLPGSASVRAVADRVKPGRDRLFPAAEPEDTIVAAPGVSCRPQIFHGAGRTAWHPVELVREALADRGR